MSIGSGLGGQLMIAPETVYGTFVTPTRAVEVKSAKLQERLHIQQGTGLAAGRSVDLGSRRTNTWSDAGGDVDGEFLTTGMALLLAHALGSTATLTQIASTTAYTLTAPYGVPDGMFFSAQAGVPDTAGTVIRENFHGCKIAKSTWTIERGGLLMYTYTVDAQQKEETTALAAATYTPTSQDFSANGMLFKAGTFGAESAIDGVRKFTLSLERSLDVERIYLGNTNKSEPLSNGVTKITGSMDVDLLPSNKAVLWDIYHSQGSTSIVADFVGSQIGASGHNNELVFNTPQVFIDQDGTPDLEGPDITKATLNFSALIDGSNHTPMSAVLTTGDTTF